MCLCAHVQKAFFTSYSQTPCVPAIGLSHSYWPRCHPSLHPRQTFSRSSGPRGLKRGDGDGVRRGIEFRAKAILDVKRHLYLFPKTFSTVLTNIKWHCCHTTANSKCCCCYLFCPNTVIHAGSVPHCSRVPTACRLQSLTFFWFGLALFLITNCVSFTPIFPLDIKFLPLHQK